MLYFKTDDIWEDCQYLNPELIFVWMDYLEKDTSTTHKSSNDMLAGSSGRQRGISQRELQPLNILDVHYEEIFLKICSCLLTCKLPQVLTFWRAFLSPMQIRKLLFCPICLLVFICLNVLVLFPPLSFSLLLFFSIYPAPPGERWRKRIYSRSVLSAPYTRWGLSYQAGVLSAAFAHYMALLTLLFDFDTHS